MRRRSFLATLGVLAAWPRSVIAQQPTQIRCIGVLMAVAEDDALRANYIGAFLVLLRHKRRRLDCLICRVQQGQRERFLAMATISLRRIVAIEFGM